MLIYLFPEKVIPPEMAKINRIFETLPKLVPEHGLRNLDILT